MARDAQETAVWRIDVADEGETIAVAHEVVALLRRGDMVTLSGDLGAGKTTFAACVLCTPISIALLIHRNCRALDGKRRSRTRSFYLNGPNARRIICRPIVSTCISASPIRFVPTQEALL